MVTIKGGGYTCIKDDVEGSRVHCQIWRKHCTYTTAAGMNHGGGVEEVLLA